MNPKFDFKVLFLFSCFVSYLGKSRLSEKYVFYTKQYGNYKLLHYINIDNNSIFICSELQPGRIKGE
jgi:hypothetical protein